jgi:hypothetical protein
MAAAAPIYPSATSADPYSASFYANQAALEFSRNNLEAEDQRSIREAEANYNYNRSVNERAEPLKLTANRNSANTAGLAESGVLAKTQGVTETGYAQKNQRLGETRKNAVEKYTQGENTAREDFNLKTAADVAKEEENQVKEAEANPPTPQYPGVPASAGRIVTGPTEAGGVLPYESGGKGQGSVRVGQPNSTAYVGKSPLESNAEAAARRAATKAREAAMRKAVG